MSKDSDRRYFGAEIENAVQSKANTLLGENSLKRQFLWKLAFFGGLQILTTFVSRCLENTVLFLFGVVNTLGVVVISVVIEIVN